MLGYITQYFKPSEASSPPISTSISESSVVKTVVKPEASQDDTQEGKCLTSDQGLTWVESAWQLPKQIVGHWSEKVQGDLRFTWWNLSAVTLAIGVLIPSMTYPLYAACRLVFGTLYPAYASYKAVRTKNVREYVKWMMYWIVFAFFTTFESMADLFIAFWFPFYYELKIIFLLWLISPVSRGSLGSSMLYRKLIHPNLMKREDEIDRMIGKLQEQGYNTAIRFGSQAFQYVTNLVMTTAIRAPEILAELANAQRPSDQVDSVANNRPRRIPLQQQNLLGSSPVLEVLDRSDDIDMDDLDTFQENELSRQTDVIMNEMNRPTSTSSRLSTQRTINFGYSEDEDDDDDQPGALVVTRVPNPKKNTARVPLDFSSGSEDDSKPIPSTSNVSVALPRRGRAAKTKANKALSEQSDANLNVEPQKKTKGGRRKKTSEKLT